MLNTKSIKVVTTIDELSDNVIYYIQGSGTSSDPYVISKDTDMELLLTYPSANFVLGNDIDMNEATRTMIGNFYNNGNGWSNRSFSGVLDGKGHKISNLYSKDGGLFYDINDATVKNLWLDNVEVYSSYNAGILGRNVSGNSSILNIYITNSKVSNDGYAGGLFASVEGGTIKNIHMSSNSIYSPTISGGVSAIMNPTNDISIMNVFIDSSYIFTDKDGISGKIVGNLIYEGDIDTLKNSYFAYNKVNTKTNSSYSNASVMIAVTTSNVTENDEIISYNPYTKNITSIDNNVLNDEEIKDKNNFDNYDFNNIWGFDSKPYLKMFYEDEVEEVVVPLNISFKTYKIQNDVIYGLVPSINVQTFINDMIINDKLTYKIYNKNGLSLTNSDKLTTNSYIVLSNGSENKYYYIAIYGDVNGDGRVSITDVYRIADYIIVPVSQKGNYLASKAELIAANVNNDSKISITDVYKVADYVINPALGF